MIGFSNYPATVDSPSELIRAVNRVDSTVGGSGVDADDTTIPIADTSDAPADGTCWIEDESISYTGKTANSITGCVRGFDGTTANAHSAGEVVWFDPITARHHNVLAEAIIAVETKLGAGGSLSVTSGQVSDFAEAVDDRVGALVQDSATIDATYNDPGGAMTLAVIPGGVAHQSLSGAGTNTHAQIDGHIASVANPHGVTKAQVGLGSADNTSDLGKPISTATQTALDAKQPLDEDLATIAALAPTTDNVIQSVAGAWASRTMTQLKTALALVKGDVGLGNVDNTSDATKNAAAVTLTNKTLTAPTIADFTNAGHDHLDADDGGTLTIAAIPAITATAAEINFVDGVTSAIQTQLDGKANTAHAHAAADVTSGTMATARLGSGTADGTTFLRGDATWAVPSGGGGFGSEQDELEGVLPKLSFRSLSDDYQGVDTDDYQGRLVFFRAGTDGVSLPPEGAPVGEISWVVRGDDSEYNEMTEENENVVIDTAVALMEVTSINEIDDEPPPNTRTYGHFSLRVNRGGEGPSTVFEYNGQTQLGTLDLGEGGTISAGDGFSFPAVGGVLVVAQDLLLGDTTPDLVDEMWSLAHWILDLGVGTVEPFDGGVSHPGSWRITTGNTDGDATAILLAAGHDLYSVKHSAFIFRNDTQADAIMRVGWSSDPTGTPDTAVYLELNHGLGLWQSVVIEAGVEAARTNLDGFADDQWLQVRIGQDSPGNLDYLIGPVGGGGAGTGWGFSATDYVYPFFYVETDTASAKTLTPDYFWLRPFPPIDRLA